MNLHQTIETTPARLCALLAAAQVDPVRITRAQADERIAECERCAVDYVEHSGVLLLVGWDLPHNVHALRAYIIEESRTA